MFIEAAIGDARGAAILESTAVAEAMLECGLNPFNRDVLMKWFVARTGDAITGNIDPSDESGAAKRGWVVGLYGSPKYVRDMAKLQAEITHATEGGVQSAQAAALMTHFFVYGYGNRLDMASFVDAYVPGPWETPRTTPVGPKGVNAVHAAIQAVMMHDSLSGILKQCVDFGGDVDTVATIALGAASWCRTIKKDLPSHLVENLEDGPWGKGYLQKLDERVYYWLGRCP
jgi:ADP-ribosyl-[dinitrogen reductase] hydrolase